MVGTTGGGMTGGTTTGGGTTGGGTTGGGTTGTSGTGFIAAIQFTRGSDSIRLAGGSLTGGVPLSAAFTVEGVFRFPAPNTYGVLTSPPAGANIWEEAASGTEDISVYLTSSTGFGAFWTGSASSPGNGSNGGITGPTLPLNTWVHLAWVFDGAQERIYVNGALTSSVSLPGGYPPSVPSVNTALGYNSGRGDIPPSSGAVFDLACFRISSVARYSGASFAPPTSPWSPDANTLLLINPSAISGDPTAFACPGSAGITATFAAGIGSATNPSWRSY